MKNLDLLSWYDGCEKRCEEWVVKFVGWHNFQHDLYDLYVDDKDVTRLVS